MRKVVEDFLELAKEYPWPKSRGEERRKEALAAFADYDGDIYAIANDASLAPSHPDITLLLSNISGFQVIDGLLQPDEQARCQHGQQTHVMTFPVVRAQLECPVRSEKVWGIATLLGIANLHLPDQSFLILPTGSFVVVPRMTAIWNGCGGPYDHFVLEIKAQSDSYKGTLPPFAKSHQPLEVGRVYDMGVCIPPQEPVHAFAKYITLFGNIP